MEPYRRLKQDGKAVEDKSRNKGQEQWVKNSAE